MIVKPRDRAFGTINNGKGRTRTKKKEKEKKGRKCPLSGLGDEEKRGGRIEKMAKGETSVGERFRSKCT